MCSSLKNPTSTPGDELTCVLSAGFVDNGGIQYRSMTPYMLDSNTFIVGAVGVDTVGGKWFKMAVMDMHGNQISSNYLNKDDTSTYDVCDLTPCKLSFDKVASDPNFYGVTDVVTGPCSQFEECPSYLSPK